MNKILTGLLAFSLLATAALGETDYPSKAEMRALTRRVESLEGGFNASVQLSPGGLWTNVPGWRSLQVVPAGGATLSAASVGGVFRLTVRAPISSGAITNLSIGAGLVGSGTTNPLSVDPAIIDGASAGAAASALLGPPRLPEAFLSWDDSTSSVVSVYAPRMVVSAFDAVVTHGTNGYGVLRPGFLLYNNLAADGARHTYILTNSLDLTAFATNDTSWLPLGLAGTNYWKEFVRQGIQGRKGNDGAPGTDGLDGLGGFFYGPWDSGKGYVYDAEAPIVVSRAGRWYEAVASSTNRDPAAAGGTNWWTVSVSNGMDGTIVAWTNLVDRGDWWAGGDYSTNDSVWYGGNYFVVSSTNQKPPVNVHPSLGAGSVGVDSAYWHPLTLRGEKGEPGEKGDDGNEINSYVVYTLMPGTNTLFSNDASSAEKLPVWVSTSGGDLTMFWSPSAPLGTNWLSATNGELRLNGIAYPAGDAVPGATQLVLNVAGAAAVTSSLAGRVLQAFDVPVPAASGSGSSAEGYPEPAAFADGIATFWSTGSLLQAHAATGSETVRFFRASASLTNAAAIVAYICCGTNQVAFMTNNLTGFSTTGIFTNGSTNVVFLHSRAGSTNYAWGLLE